MTTQPSEHAYLATKFPLADDQGEVYAVGGTWLRQ
jgi:hypothetical protein